VQIVAVEAGSPAEAAGIEAGDIVLEFGGKQVKSLDDVSEWVRRAHVGDKVLLKLDRAGEEHVVDAVIGELDEDKIIADKVRDSGGDAATVERRMRSVGIEVADVPGNNGVRVQQEQPGGPWGAKVREDDIIVSLGGYAVPNVRTLAYLMENAEVDQVLTMGVLRSGQRGLMHGTVSVRVPALL